MSVQSAVSAQALAFDTSVGKYIEHGDLLMDSPKWSKASFGGRTRKPSGAAW